MNGLFRTMLNRWLLKDEVEKVTTDVSRVELEQMRKVANVDKKEINSAKIKGKQVAIVATTKMIAETTSGGMILAGQFVHVHEKVSQLIPQNMINIKSAYPSFKGTS